MLAGRKLKLVFVDIFFYYNYIYLQMRLYDELKLKNLKLLGKIQNLHNSIQVCCRVRPPSETETSAGGKLCVDASDESCVYIYDANTTEWVLFEVDAVWGYDHTQVLHTFCKKVLYCYFGSLCSLCLVCLCTLRL